MSSYLSANSSFDFEHPELVSYAASLVGDERNPLEIAKRLYLGVRDDIRYNPYRFDSAPEAFSASDCLTKGESYCIPKAVLLGAMCRLYGIPARLGLADVQNHLASPQFLDYLKTNIFVMHGYTDIYLNGRWVKATPAFDKNLCKLMNVQPLEFNGYDDSIFHEFDNDGAKHMEYLRDHGTFEDVPVDFIVNSIVEAYPHLVDQTPDPHNRKSFQADLSTTRLPTES